MLRWVAFDSDSTNALSAVATDAARVGTIKLANARAGVNSVTLSRRIDRATLRPGAHQVTVDGRDAAGNAAVKRTIRVTVLAPLRAR